MSRRWRHLPLLALGLTLLSACAAGRESNVGADQARSLGAPAAEIVRIAGTDKAAVRNIPLFLTGIHGQESVHLVFEEQPGEAEAVKALRVGSADLAVLTVDTVLRDRNGDLRMLAMVTRAPGMVLLVDSRQRTAIRSVHDLLGRRVGVTALGSEGHKLLSDLLEAEGMDFTAVQVVPVGKTPCGAVGVEVDAVLVGEPSATVCQFSGKAGVLVDLRKPRGVAQTYGSAEIPRTALVATTGYIQEHPETAQKTVRALVRSLEFIARTTPDDIALQVPDTFRDLDFESEPQYLRMLQENVSIFSPDGRFNLRLVEEEWTRLQQCHGVPPSGGFPYEQKVDDRFLQQDSGV